jgi:hypothetical protein
MGWWDWNEAEGVLKMWKKNGKINSDDLHFIAKMMDEGYTSGELV